MAQVTRVHDTELFRRERFVPSVPVMLSITSSRYRGKALNERQKQLAERIMLKSDIDSGFRAISERSTR